VAALNSRDIPTAGSILEHFNKDLIQKISEEYAAELEQQQLPVEMDALAQKHEGAHQSALQRFDRDKFGTESGASAGTLRSHLEKKVMAAYEARKTANSLRSGAECQDVGGLCEDDMEQQQHASLPSLGRFEARYKHCRQQFDEKCLGPGRERAQERLEKAWAREMKRFRSDYNSKLFNGLELVMLVDILVFRFFLRSSALETVGWLGFFFLQIYPKLFLSGSTSMFDSEWWQVLVRCWETVVYNPLVDLQHTWQLLLLFLALVVACWRVWKLCWNYRWYRRKDKKQRLAGESCERDLEV